MPELCSRRSRPRAAGVLALLCGLLAAGALSAQDTLEYHFDDVGVRLGAALTGDHSHGYAEYVFLVHNHSENKSHRVTLSLPVAAWGSGTHLRSISRTVEVGPEALVRVALLQPGQPSMAGQDVAVSIDGSRQDSTVPLRIVGRSHSYGGGYYSPSMGSGSAGVLVLLSPNIKPTFGATVNRAQGMAGGGGMPGGMGAPGGMAPGMPGMPGGPGVAPGAPEAWPGGGPPGGPAPPGVKMPAGGGGGPGGMAAPAPGAAPMLRMVTVNYYTTPVPVTRWTSSWLGLSRYDGVVLTGEDLRDMPSAAQMALWQYVECGGALLVLGQAAVPEGWRRSEGDVAGLARYRAGFGTCLVSTDADYERWPGGLWAEVLTSWDQTASPWRKQRSALDANTDFPVVKELGVPVVGLYLLMILFAIIIGPVNVVLLSRRRRRIWLLWTVPAISLTTCLAVMGYMIIAEGWRGQRATETFTILDQGSHRASTIGWTGFYSPLTPSGGLHFSSDTELTLQCAPESHYRGRSRQSTVACSMDWTADQHLSHGWVTARVPTHFMVRKSSLQLERVTVSRKKDGTVEAFNALGVAITSFLYADDKGQLYTAEGTIPAGSKAVLKAQNRKVDRADPLGWRILYRDDWIASFRRTRASEAALLLPRTYLAELDGAPFLEEGLDRTGKQECRSRVLGLLHEGGDEG